MHCKYMQHKRVRALTHGVDLVMDLFQRHLTSHYVPLQARELLGQFVIKLGLQKGLGYQLLHSGIFKSNKLTNDSVLRIPSGLVNFHLL